MDLASAPRHQSVDVLHGHRVEDPYRWLEDSEDPATVAWSTAQDQRWQAWIDQHPSRQWWRDRLEALVPGYRSAPWVIGERRFWLERAAPSGDRPGDDHAVLWVRDQAGARPLVDPNALSRDGTVTLDGWAPSLEGARLAYLLSSGGDEESRLWILDVDSGETVDGPIDRLRYSSLGWLPGGEELLYVRRLAPDQVPAGEEAFHRRLWHHRVGTDPAGDVLLFGEGLDPTAYLGVGVSPDGAYASVTVSLGTAPRNELHVADLASWRQRNPGRRDQPPEWRPALAGADARAWPHFDRRGGLWILTDLDAPRGRLCVADPADASPAHWRVVVAEDPDGGILEDFALGGDHLVVVRSRHACSEITVHDRTTGAVHRALELPGPGTAEVVSRPDEGPKMWVGFTDFTTPYVVWPWDPAHQTRVGPDRRTSAPPADLTHDGTADDRQVVTRRVSYRSADGTEVRMTVMTPPGDGPWPAVLYGYGGFDVSLTPTYSSSILAWVQAGGMWAVANLRGGSEEGQEWHRAGLREHKQQVFEDFEAAADALVNREWTTPGQLGIFGGSNGGLLVGAALTRRPESYRAVVCSAPLLDMVRYEQFGLGATWHDEYGTAADETELGWLLAYSPYHHVTAGRPYPAVLFTVFDGDSRVDPLHARKMAAALQWASASSPEEYPVLLRREADVGHGARAVHRGLDLAADQLTFLADQLGLALRP